MIGAFARSWALELKARGIRVNLLSSGPVETAILEKMGIAPEDPGGLGAAIPLGRLGQPAELARAALFLASNASSFVTGINLSVDGGMALLKEMMIVRPCPCTQREESYHPRHSADDRDDEQ